jgi:hypothetical protein
MKPAVLMSTKCKVAAAVFCLMLGIAFLNCAPLFAQGTAGKILGTVVDQSGGAIAGATVTVTDIDRGVPRTLTTGQAGEYTATNLLPGNYKVRAEAKGFKIFERSGIVLDVNAEVRVDLTMQPGEVSQTITVNEAVPMVETTNAELGATLQSSIIEDIPLNGRNFVNLLQLNPGVTIYPGGAGFTQSANGQRPHDNAYMVNGIMASDPWMGQSVFNAVMAAGDAGTIMPVDAIDEFKTEENPRAEFGWKPGAIVNVGVKSGTNSFHGSGYAYGRDTAFDARNFFNPATAPAGAPAINPTKQPVGLEQFGGTFGGPVKKDKLFFFANYEGQRYSIGNPNSIPTPSQSILKAACIAALGMPAPATGSASGTGLSLLSASLAGLTPTCAIDPSKLTADKGGIPFQGLFPSSTGGNVLTDLLSVNSVNGGLAKVNYHLNDKNQFEGMYFISQGDSNSVDTPPAETSANWISAQHARSQAVSGDWAFTPNSTVVNEVRFGYSHYYQTFFGTDASQNAATYNFNGNTYEIPTGINPVGPGGASYGGAPDIRFQDYYGGGANNAIGVGWPKIVGPDSVLEFLDHVSILKGKHAFKFGGEFVYNQSTTDETANAKGQIRFQNPDQFFLGNVRQGALFLGNAVRTLYNNNYAAFLQDDWRIKPTLTINLGIRYELSAVVHERDGLMGNFDPVQGLVQTNNPYNGDHNNFAPRIGFAWDIGGSGKTVLRGAAGILYEQYSFDVMNGEGNLLGLRTFPTGLPLYNAGSTTPLALAGNIQLQSLTFAKGSASLNPINSAWQNFNPALPVAGQTTLFSGVTNPACGDGFTLPSGYLTPPTPCEVYGVDRNIRTPYVSNWNLDIQHAITNNLSIDVGYVGNHGTKLLGKLNINQPAVGAGWGNPADPTSPAGMCVASATDPTPYDNCSSNGNLEQAAEPFTAPCAGNIYVNGTPKVGPTLGSNGPGGIFNPTNSCLSYLSYVTQLKNIYNSNYNGLQITLTGRNYHGLSFTGGYTYSHALGDASDQGTSANFPAPTNSYGSLRQQLYANTDFDIRHRFTLSLDYAIPGRKGFGQLLEGWAVNTVVVVTSGLPWGLSDQSNDFTGVNVAGTGAQSFGEQWDFFGKPSDFTPVHGWTDTNGGWQTGPAPGVPGGGLPYSGDDASGTIMQKCVTADTTHFSGNQQTLALASLAALGCYAVGNSVLLPPPFGSYGNTKANIFRDGGFKNVDFSVTKTFSIRERFKAEARVEVFNILNHVNFSNPAGGPGGTIPDPTAQPFGFIGLTPDTYSSNPQLGSGGERGMQLGLKLSF